MQSAKESLETILSGHSGEHGNKATHRALFGCISHGYTVCIACYTHNTMHATHNTMHAIHITHKHINVTMQVSSAHLTLA